MTTGVWEPKLWRGPGAAGPERSGVQGAEPLAGFELPEIATRIQFLSVREHKTAFGSYVQKLPSAVECKKTVFGSCWAVECKKTAFGSCWAVASGLVIPRRKLRTNRTYSLLISMFLSDWAQLFNLKVKQQHNYIEYPGDLHRFSNIYW